MIARKSARLQQSVIDEILRLTKPGDSILEFGSGESTRQFAAAGRLVTAIEHDKKWIKAIEGVDFVHAKIVGKWYDEAAVFNAILGKRFNLILIDGPKGYGATDRLGVIGIAQIIKPDFVVVDDIHRPNEKLIADSIKGSKRVIGRACFCEMKPP